MDLNKLYSQHQVAVMKACAAASHSDRREHLGMATDIARQIGSYQLTQGANASRAWLGPDAACSCGSGRKLSAAMGKGEPHRCVAE